MTRRPRPTLIFGLTVLGVVDDNAYCAQRVSVKATGGNAIQPMDDDDDDVCPATRYNLAAAASPGASYDVTVMSEDRKPKVYNLRVIVGPEDPNWLTTPNPLASRESLEIAPARFAGRGRSPERNITMEPNNLIERSLGLRPPWYLEETEIDRTAGRVRLHLDFEVGGTFTCGSCGADGCKAYDTLLRRWRHLPLFEYDSYVHAPCPRVRCPSCGIKRARLPWARPRPVSPTPSRNSWW